MPEDCMVDIKTKDKNLVHGLLTAKEPSGLEQIIKCEDFSTPSIIASDTSIEILPDSLTQDST